MAQPPAIFVQVPFDRMGDLQRALTVATGLGDTEAVQQLRELLAVGQLTSEPIMIGAALLNKITLYAWSPS